MKRLLSIIIGLAVTLGGMHIMPVHAMETGMMDHCSLCSKEDRDSGKCDPPVQHTKDQINNTSPANKDCGCHFDPDANSHHAGITESNGKQLKEKASAVSYVRHFYDLVHPSPIFNSVKSINAPPSYLTGINTVRQLK